ncbi:MAG: glycosyltransferase [Bacteroidetes bacterium]|nr:glycosyltransferase [Bacteroidota bacterium]
MSENPLISIILPFKDEEKFISECLSSIVKQTFTNWEAIVINDHSVDSSPNIVGQFSRSDSRIKLIQNNGKGVIEAMNTGLEISRGKFITRMDADDIKMPDNLESMYRLINDNAIVLGKVKYFRSDGLRDGYRQYGDWMNDTNTSGKTWKNVYRECTVPSPCWLTSKENLMAAGGFNSPFYPEDYDLCFRFYKLGLEPKCTSEIIHLWRDHEYRTTRVSEWYSDNRFTDLKIHYFLDIDFNPRDELLLWGAGKKAKRIASVLVKKKITFRWMTNNLNKVNKEIYGVMIENSEGFNPNQTQQILVAISGFENEPESQNIITRDKTYVFC